MDWKAELESFRKSLDLHLKSLGFEYKKQNLWRCPLGDWAASFGVEISQKDKGLSRQFFVSVSLNKTVELDEKQARAECPITLSDSRTYAIYSVSPPDLPFFQETADNAEEVAKLLRHLETQMSNVWLPWMKRESQRRGRNTAGAHKRYELVREGLDYVP